MRCAWYTGLTIVAFIAAIALMIAAFRFDRILFCILAIGLLAVSYYASGKADEHDKGFL